MLNSFNRERYLVKVIVSENTYSCPNCGHHFKPDYDTLRLPFVTTFFYYFRVPLVCPECNVRGTCRRVKERE